MLSQAMEKFVTEQPYKTPYLLIDSSIITQQFKEFQFALPSVRCHFSVKSNASHSVLKHMNQLGSYFEVASWGEIETCLSLGIAAEKLHFGNTVKKAEDVRLALDAGIKTFAFDCIQEMHKLLSIDPNIHLVCRVVTDGEGAVWRLHDKFGCSRTHAVDLCRKAIQGGGKIEGLSFHVGSQQRSVDAWCRALDDIEFILQQLEEEGITLSLINIGGGFPASGYIDHDEHVEDFNFTEFCEPLRRRIDDFKQSVSSDVQFIAEPGRFITAQSGCIKTTVLLSTERFFHDHNVMWTYLDVGKFNGLYEASDVKLQASLLRECSEELVETMLAGPSCDSEDVLSLSENLHHLPSDIKEGDVVVFSEVGAYSMSYSCVAFNGIPPLKEYFI